MTNADTPWPMKTSPAAEDYIAALATQVLLRAGCDHLPVNAVNLLRLVRQRTRQRDGSSVLSSSCREEFRGRDKTEEPSPCLTNAITAAEDLLCLLLARMGRPFRSAAERRLFVTVFTCHLLCPRPLLRLLGQPWCSRAFLKETLALPPQLESMLLRCPACYVPADLNAALLAQLREIRQRDGSSVLFQPRKVTIEEDNKTEEPSLCLDCLTPMPNEVDLSRYLEGYEDAEFRLRERPAMRLEKLEAAVDALIPAHSLTLDHPDSLYIEDAEDFASFYPQFAAMSLLPLYRKAYGEDPPQPLLGNRPKPGEKNYAANMESYLAREEATRLALAQRLFHQAHK